jgi:hypothetical protein
MCFSKRLPGRGERHGHRATASHRPEPGVRFADADDQAHYACVCGHAFEASVIASVRCPRCGTAQPW